MRVPGGVTVQGIVTENGRGLVADPPDALVSRYNDLFDNTETAHRASSSRKLSIVRDQYFVAPRLRSR